MEAVLHRRCVRRVVFWQSWLAGQSAALRAAAAARLCRRCSPPSRGPLALASHRRRSPVCAVVPNGVATGLDIGLSNYSLVFITLSFYVMAKSTTPIFLLTFAVAMGVERCAPPCRGFRAALRHPARRGRRPAPSGSNSDPKRAQRLALSVG